MSSTEHLFGGEGVFCYGVCSSGKSTSATLPISENLLNSELSIASSNFSFISSVSSRSNISLENEKHQLAEKKGIHGIRAPRHRFCCIYRRLFTVVLSGNTGFGFSNRETVDHLSNRYGSQSHSLRFDSSRLHRQLYLHDCLLHPEISTSLALAMLCSGLPRWIPPQRLPRLWFSGS
jgi:hypothetical protein